MSIGKRIAEVRRAKGFTQEYVALQLGVSRQAVGKWEKDISRPDTNNLIALAGLLEISVSSLVGQNEQTPPAVGMRISSVFRKIAVFLLIAGFLLYAIGLFSGEFNRQVFLFQIGIPLLYYGRSILSVVLLSFSIACTFLSILFFIISHNGKPESG